MNRDHPKMKQTAFLSTFLQTLMVLSVFAATSALAQNAPAVPVEDVQAEQLVGTRTNQLTVLELFSSQACVFCPKADALLGDLIQNDNIIGLACHIDYFDVSEGSLARPFCTERQNAYEAALRAGPNFTPQIVINGEYDVVGYKLQDVSDVIHKAGMRAPERIKIEAMKEKNAYKIIMPTMTLTRPTNVQIFFLDAPHTVKVAEGGNRDKVITYHNVVSRIDPVMEWAGAGKGFKGQIVLSKRHKGFVILASDPQTQAVVAAGQYKKPVTTVSKP